MSRLWKLLIGEMTTFKGTGATSADVFKDIHRCQGERTEIPANYCEKLVEGNPKRLIGVMQFKGNDTKH